MLIGYYNYENTKYGLSQRVPVTKIAAEVLDDREAKGEIRITKREILPSSGIFSELETRKTK